MKDESSSFALIIALALFLIFFQVLFLITTLYGIYK